MSEFLVHEDSPTLDPEAWRAAWGAVEPAQVRGGAVAAPVRPARREVHLLQRGTGRLGKGLGKTSGWVHRAALAHAAVELHAGVTYERIDDDGLHLTVPDADGRGERAPRLLAVDTVVLCAGQEPRRELVGALAAVGVVPHVIGGADEAREIDAKRAIRQGTELAARL